MIVPNYNNFLPRSTLCRGYVSTNGNSRENKKVTCTKKILKLRRLRRVFVVFFFSTRARSFPREMNRLDDIIEYLDNVRRPILRSLPVTWNVVMNLAREIGAQVLSLKLHIVQSCRYFNDERNPFKHRVILGAVLSNNRAGDCAAIFLHR